MTSVANSERSPPCERGAHSAKTNGSGLPEGSQDVGDNHTSHTRVRTSARHGRCWFHLAGLLGNNDRYPSNNLTSGFGTVLPASASPATIDGTFAASWRVTPEQSLFTYNQNDSTATYTHRTFRSTVMTFADLAETALADGTSHCVDANVVDGAFFDDCVIDWALSQDANYVSGAAAQTAPAAGADARPIDQAGQSTRASKPR
jgi:hypothetical protein